MVSYRYKQYHGRSTDFGGAIKIHLACFNHWAFPLDMTNGKFCRSRPHRGHIREKMAETIWWSPCIAENNPTNQHYISLHLSLNLSTVTRINKWMFNNVYIDIHIFCYRLQTIYTNGIRLLLTTVSAWTILMKCRVYGHALVQSINILAVARRLFSIIMQSSYIHVQKNSRQLRIL